MGPDRFRGRMFGRDPYPPPPPPPFIRDRMLSGGFGGKVSVYTVKDFSPTYKYLY